jgi:hypothetical protein
MRLDSRSTLNSRLVSNSRSRSNSNQTSSISFGFVSLMLVYVLLLALCAPWVVRSVTASSSGDATAKSPRDASKLRGGGKSPATNPWKNAQSTARCGRRDGEVLVRFRVGVTNAQQSEIVASIGAKELRPLRGESRVARIILNAGQTFESISRIC